jgi:hypothetical protein
MSRITIDDLAPGEALTHEEMEQILGAGRHSFQPSIENLERRDMMAAGFGSVVVSPMININVQHIDQTVQAFTGGEKNIGISRLAVEGGDVGTMDGLGAHHAPAPQPFDPVQAIAGRAWSGVVLKFHHKSGTIYYDAAYHVVINWGDGTTSVGTARLVHLDMLALDGTFEVLGSHTYARAGNYQIKVTVDAENTFHTEVLNSASVKNPGQADLLRQASLDNYFSHVAANKLLGGTEHAFFNH